MEKQYYIDKVNELRIKLSIEKDKGNTEEAFKISQELFKVMAEAFRNKNKF